MIKRRIITLGVLNTQTPQFGGVIQRVALGILFVTCFSGVVHAQTIDVWPTGDFFLDRGNVKNAIELGDTVLLHATNKSGTPTAFNFEDIWIWKDVTIQGEKLGSSVKFVTPDGPIFSDRAVVFRPSDKYGEAKLAFAVGQGQAVIEDLRFDSFSTSAIHVQGCSSGGVVIHNNVITHSLRTIRQHGIWIFGGSINGDITIEKNEINDALNGILARQTVDLDIFSNTINNVKVGIDVQTAANLHIANNTINNAGATGIWSGQAADLHILDNTVYNAQTCIDGRNTSKGTINNNTMTGGMQRGIYLNDVSNLEISGNIISRVISPPWHKWWNGAIALDYGENNTVFNNEIMGEGRSAIHLYRTHNNFILDNDCSGYTCKWSDPEQSWNVCQFWDSGSSSGNTVSGNIWGPVAPESRLATVVISYRPGGSPSGDNILDNDYRTYNNVPGWTASNPDGPGCVMLTEGTENNLVRESGHFPRGTDAKSQVMDLGINNRVVGHDADDVDFPGIGQRLKEIQAQIDALPAEQVEMQETGEALSANDGQLNIAR